MALHEQLIERRAILAAAGQTLKSEFIGLDRVIDDVIECLSSWFLFPNLHDRPIIVNLWGMTGVGKSSLVKRLSQLIGFGKKYYRFDIGEKSFNEWVVKHNLTEIYKRENGQPVILAFDEFQHARTKDEEGKEIDQVSSRIVWEILDSGKFQSSQSFNGVAEIYDLQLKLRGLLERGVIVQDGVVMHGHDLYIREFQNTSGFFHAPRRYKPKKGEKLFFIPDDVIENIFWMARDLFETQLDVRPYLEKMNGAQTIHFLTKVMEIGETPKTVDCSHSLIFIIGNLDEVYTMSSNLNPDIDADSFYDDSLKINISHVKRALRIRFRSEQIARLGNTHIIYPAVNKNSFRMIIRKELDNIEKNLKKELGIQFTFDETVVDIVYMEGVFPSQGVRPIFTTISQLISSKLGFFAERIILYTPRPSYVRVRVVDKALIVETTVKNRKVILVNEPLNLSLDKLRQSTKDELQSIVAVHESGHAIVIMAITGVIPRHIYSITADAGSNGFVFMKEERKYFNQTDMEMQTAEILAGHAAEARIFGRQHITNGSSSDIEKATSFVARMVKDSGLGDRVAHIRSEDNRASSSLFDLDGRANAEIQQHLKNGYQRACEVIQRESLLLLRMATYLSEHSVMSPQMIKEYVDLFGSEELKQTTAQNHTFSYRTTLHSLNTKAG